MEALRKYIVPCSIIAMLLSLLGLRLIYLSADPPENLSWSLGLFFDEGLYNHSARNQMLFGTWKLDEWSDFYYAPISTLLKYAMFRVAGVGRVQMRLFSVLLSWLGIILAYRATRESYGTRTGLIAALLFGGNYIYLMYNRLGMQDSQTLTVFLLVAYCWQKGMNVGKQRIGLWLFFLAGLCCVLTYSFKNLFVYLLPTPFVALAAYLGLRWRDNALRSYLSQALGMLVAGSAFAGLLWFWGFYVPNKASIGQFGAYMMSLMFPERTLAAVLENLNTTPFFHYFVNSPIILLGTAFWFWYLGYAVCSEKRGRIHPMDIFLITWFWAAFLFPSMSAYRPTRYFLPVIAPMCLLTARMLGVFFSSTRIRFPQRLQWAFFPASLAWISLVSYVWLFPAVSRGLARFPIGVIRSTPRVNLSFSLGLAILLTGGLGYALRRFRQTQFRLHPAISQSIALLLLITALFIEGHYYYQWVRTPQFRVPGAGKDIERRLGTNAYIGGMDAPGVAFDSPYKTLFAWDQFLNYAENPIRQYGLTHLFLAESRSVPEVSYYRQRYPEDMARAVLLQQYSIKGVLFSLFSLVTPRIERVMPRSAMLLPKESLQVGLHLVNPDWRMAHKMLCAWSLYAAAPESFGVPVATSHEVAVWMPPNTEQTVRVPGMLPEQAGTYRLFASWKPAQEAVFEAEKMERQLGRIVSDITASGNRAVYHEGSISPLDGFIAYGGVYADYQPGVYEAVFQIKVKHTTPTHEPVLKVDVAANYGQLIIAQRELRATDLSNTNAYQSIILPYALQGYASTVEFRVFSYGNSDVWVDAVRLMFHEGIWDPEDVVIADPRE